MSSIAQCRGAVHLLIVFVCVLVCEGGFLDFGQPKHEGDEGHVGGALLQRAQAMIEFPELDEMSSTERANNRQRARKVATIIEKSIHMLANDLLQMWAITRTEKDDGEDIDVETEGQGGESNAGPDRESPEEEGAETTEGANAKAIEGSRVNSIRAAVANAPEEVTPQQTPEGLGGDKIEGGDAKTAKGVGAESNKGAEDEATEGVGVKLTKGEEEKTTEGVEKKVIEREEAKSTEGVEVKSTEGAQSKTTKVPIKNSPEGKEGSLATQEDVRNSDVAQNTNAGDLKKTQTIRTRENQRGKYIISDGKNGRTLSQVSELLVK